jgi:adenylylsulfate kinase
MSTNITWHNQTVSRSDRWKTHKGAVVWFTGLSGAGKSSVANEVERRLSRTSLTTPSSNVQGEDISNTIRTYLLDGDNIRHGLCSDLGFTVQDRSENIRRVGEVSKLMADAGVVTLSALISPYRKEREQVRDSVQQLNDNSDDASRSIPFIEIYVKASLNTCEQRDPKGLYKLAREGKIKQFTGIDDPYEEPHQPELVLDADTKSVDELAEETVRFILERIKLT